MQKATSALKWLAEKRARLAGQLESREQVLELIREVESALGHDDQAHYLKP